MLTFHSSDHEEFIKLVLLLFCFAQRPSFPCDTQKRESVVTRLNWKDLINSSAVWDFQKTPLQTGTSHYKPSLLLMKLSMMQSLWLEHQLNFDPFIIFTIWILVMHFAEKESFHHVVSNNLRNCPWTISCANFSLETWVCYQNHKEVF